MNYSCLSSTPIIGFTGQLSDTLLTAPSSPVKLAIMIHEVSLTNSSGSDAVVGYGYKIPDANYVVGQWDDSAGTKIIDDTTDAQDAGTDDVALFTTTNNDGFVVGSSAKFNNVNLVISTAEVGSPTYEYTYWDGSAWSTLTLIETPDYTAAAEDSITFAAPINWAKGGDTNDGADSDKYYIRVRATTAPLTAPLATTVKAVNLVEIIPTLSTGALLNKEEYKMANKNRIPTGHEVVAYCSVADGANTVQIDYIEVP